jgi:hypothetical protein
MKKLALSVVALMVAGAGVSVSAVGCSSSSSTGTTQDDSGTVADVTTGDSGETGETSTTDDGATDSGSAEAACLTDAGGSIAVEVPNPDGGDPIENTACEQCIATNCSAAQTTCLDDCSMVPQDDASVPACGAYAVCVYSSFLTKLQTSDAGLAADLTAAQTSCAGTFSPSSTGPGNALIGCIASSCASASAGCIPQ